MSRRVGLVVGDTPGHFYPALAVAEEFRARAADTEILFFGPRGGPAAALAAQHGCEYRAVSSSQIAGVGRWQAAMAVAGTLRGIGEARRMLREARIRLVIGFGGFASGAVVLAARTLGCGAVIHEANVVPGLANRWLGRAASRVFVSPWMSDAFFQRDRVVSTGWPVRADMHALAGETRVPPSGRPARVLVCAGSRGGACFARTMPAVGARLAAAGHTVEIRHQSGDADADRVRDAYVRSHVPADVMPFIDDMAAAYRWADLAVARAGAGTIAELALAGLPSLLVPLPDAAENHQATNAHAYAATGAAVMMLERDARPDDVASKLIDLLNPHAWSAASSSARGLAAPRAAGAAADACERLMEGRW